MVNASSVEKAHTDSSPTGVHMVAEKLNNVLADTLALFLKTKNFHWHVSGPHFRDYHLLFDDHAREFLEMADAVAERVRKIGFTTLHSVADVARLQRIADNNREFVTAVDMLTELRDDNLAMVHHLREVRKIAEASDDTATSSFADNLIDQTERRMWFLSETSRHREPEVNRNHSRRATNN